jgi:sugar-specific transcriptional regulator TrmB
MDGKIKETLKTIGLTNGEIDVYLALIDLGQSTTGKITKMANISGSKVYEVLQRLNHKGLVSYVIERGTKHYCATPVERLIDFLTEKQQEIENGKSKIKELIPLLKTKRLEHEYPEATIYRGKKGALVALNMAIEIGLTGAEMVGFGSEDYPSFFPAQMNEYVKIAKKHKFKTKLLFKKGYKSPNTNAQIRYLPDNIKLPVRTMIFGDIVAIVDFDKPMTTIVIEKKAVADTYRTIFNTLWNISK